MLLTDEAVSVDTVPLAGNAVLLVVLADIGEGPVGELAMIRWPADCTNVCSAKVNVLADRAEAPGKVNVEDPMASRVFPAPSTLATNREVEVPLAAPIVGPACKNSEPAETTIVWPSRVCVDSCCAKPCPLGSVVVELPTASCV